MSAGTRVRTFRLSDSEYTKLMEWGAANLGKRDFSSILRHIIRQAVHNQRRT